MIEHKIAFQPNAAQAERAMRLTTVEEWAQQSAERAQANVSGLYRNES